ncbi:type 2 periplasmic-binding domain-containing protein [Ectopseudomonas oleovorans]|uniref:hypothetical protein n=1 Tax=Ectopseudomonas oleovorans TaxID=301 RepID=UPI0010BF3471|nr:hypothetical protein [Pseudomonas oleovorans]
MKSQHRDWYGMFALAICVLVWAQIARSFFIYTYNESMMYKVFFNAFSYAPISYAASIFAAVKKRLNGKNKFGTAEIALLGSLLPTGIFLSQDIPQRIYDSRDLATTFALILLILPTIISIVSCWLAKRRYNSIYSSKA